MPHRRPDAQTGRRAPGLPGPHRLQVQAKIFAIAGRIRGADGALPPIPQYPVSNWPKTPSVHGALSDAIPFDLSGSDEIPVNVNGKQDVSRSPNL